jgi:hypothetical protein
VTFPGLIDLTKDDDTVFVASRTTMAEMQVVNPVDFDAGFSPTEWAQAQQILKNADVHIRQYYRLAENMRVDHIAVQHVSGVHPPNFKLKPSWKDYASLRPGIWLNDEVIEYYNRLLMTRENPAVRAYWLPTFFYPILVGRTQVERRKTHNFDQVKPFTRADFTRPRRHGQHL